MLTHTLRSVPRLALATVVAGTLIAGALAGSANAAGDRPQSGASLTVRKAGGEQQELIVRKAGREQQELTVRKAGGEQRESSIIAVL